MKLRIKKKLTSRDARDFLARLEMVYPLPIKSLQTDNGAEFLGDFDPYLKHKGIPHSLSWRVSKSERMELHCLLR